MPRQVEIVGSGAKVDQPWYSAWGLEGRIATASADQTGITTIVDITSLTLTWTPTPGRRYRCVIYVRVEDSVVTDIVTITLANGSNTVINTGDCDFGRANTGVPRTLIYNAPASLPQTSVTWKARIGRSVGTGTVKCASSATSFAFITIEDTGPF